MKLSPRGTGEKALPSREPKLGCRRPVHGLRSQARILLSGQPGHFQGNVLLKAPILVVCSPLDDVQHSSCTHCSGFPTVASLIFRSSRALPMKKVIARTATWRRWQRQLPEAAERLRPRPLVRKQLLRCLPGRGHCGPARVQSCAPRSIPRCLEVGQGIEES